VLLVPKPDVKEEDDELVALLRQQRLVASSDFNAVFMSSLNNHAARAGNIEDVIG
jgi:hypothetical protein